MDVLKNLFGNLSSGLIRLIVTVGILGAVYLFIVKPTLDTTNNAINRGFDAIPNQQQITKEFQQGFNQHGTSPQVKHQIKKQFHVTIRNANGAQTQKLLHCVQAANGDVGRMQNCVVRFQ